MSDKSQLLTIGQVATYTGVSIDSLRYYERMELLQPTWIDPVSRYRYYSFEQIYVIYIISMCIQLDIPLKSLGQYISKQNTVNYGELLATGKAVAQEKIQQLQKGLSMMDALEAKINQISDYPHTGEVYTRYVDEKYVLVEACEVSQVHKRYEAMKFAVDRHQQAGLLGAELLECGYLCVYKHQVPTYYLFAELLSAGATQLRGEIWRIPAGDYQCRQHTKSALREAGSLWHDLDKGVGDYLAIETDVFSKEHQINAPNRELRISGVLPENLKY